jgi:hypothetical protein
MEIKSEEEHRDALGQDWRQDQAEEQNSEGMDGGILTIGATGNSFSNPLAIIV